VLHAAALGEQGATYVLEMGEQVLVLEMARNLIRLSGFVPDEEIPITFTGLRPGEKLAETLASADEIPEPSPVDKIIRLRPRLSPSASALAQGLVILEAAAAESDQKGTVRRLMDLVPDFRPTDTREG
jgi:FlaA1/EpsC-like NDP-sugar epimerase